MYDFNLTGSRCTEWYIRLLFKSVLFTNFLFLLVGCLLFTFAFPQLIERNIETYCIIWFCFVYFMSIAKVTKWCWNKMWRIRSSEVIHTITIFIRFYFIKFIFIFPLFVRILWMTDSRLIINNNNSHRNRITWWTANQQFWFLLFRSGPFAVGTWNMDNTERMWNKNDFV